MFLHEPVDVTKRGRIAGESRAHCEVQAVFQLARSVCFPHFVILATLPRTTSGPTSATLSFAPSPAWSLHQRRFGSGDQAMWMVLFFATMVSLGALGLLTACENK
jgi:hypothetical protein